MNETQSIPFETWFYAGSFGVSEEKVYRHTARCVWIGQPFYQRRSSRENYFPTREEAQQRFFEKLDENISYWEQKRDGAQRALERLYSERDAARAKEAA